MADDALTSRYRAFRFGWSVLPATERRLMLGKVASGIALGLLGTVPPLLIRTLLDTVLPRRDGIALAELTVAGLGLYLVLALAGVVDQWLQARVTEGLGRALRDRFFAKVLDLPFAFFVHSRSGQLLSRLTVDVRTAQGVLRNGGSVATSVVTFAATLSVMLWLSRTVTLLALAVLPVVVLADRRFSARIAAQSKRKLSSYASLTAYTAERTNPGGALLVRAAGERAAEVAGFGERSATVWRTAIRGAVLGRAYSGVLAVCAGIGVLTVLYVGGRLALEGTLQLGSLVALAQYSSRAYRPVVGIAGTRMRILDAAVALNRIRVFVESDSDDERPALPGAAPASAEVVFDDVWFRYPVLRTDVPGAGEVGDDVLPVLVPDVSPWILRGVSFRAAPGTKLAVVGESGAGKSTIAYLLAGLFRADRGTVSIGGVDVRELPAAALRRGVGLVTQEAYLFSGTIADNVRYGRPDATDEQVVAACRTAGVDADIEALPDGYATIVGERGYRLSGGQKQRVSLARALLCDCPVVVLDEATSHLEAERDGSIQHDLLRELPDRVLIVAAHRLSSVVDADEIIVLADGRICERGRHTELDGANGRYAHLFRAQTQPMERSFL